MLLHGNRDKMTTKIGWEGVMVDKLSVMYTNSLVG